MANDAEKQYRQYYTRVLGIKPDMALVKKAAEGKYTMAEFQLLIQRQDTDRFLRTAQGQEVAGTFRDLWATIFPSLGSQPGIRALRIFLKGKPGGDYRTITNPTSRRDMYAFLAKTKLFKKIYPEFKNTAFLRTLNFAGYRAYKDEFKNIMRQYTGRFATDDEISSFFVSKITPQDFEKNLGVVLTGSDAYRWGTGQGLGAEEQQKALYGGSGSMLTLQKISNELEKQSSYMKADRAQFGIERDSNTGRIKQENAY